MQARRKLKATDIVIKEDLTHANYTLLSQTTKHDKVVNCWTSDGHLRALVKTNDQREIKVTINSVSNLSKL
ncbi:hypothetical protein HOLleu_43520 [Holothuria leucospilota]|uniref:Uncharacterized protein n=1 Tax=Holothuria leucospilota TaxID=206669 RepID=A0A9Q0YBH5_HOLLE|nr:hypothetical protein HOLleu_43520 [Holothuria leucospilota]